MGPSGPPQAGPFGPGLALLARVCFDGKDRLRTVRELEFEVAISMELRLK